MRLIHRQWRKAARRLLGNRFGGDQPPATYYADPARGLGGTIDPADRNKGLEPLLADAAGRSVLDLGCAEGLIAEAFLDAGARRVHGLDIHQVRVDDANRLFGGEPRASFAQADIGDWNAFQATAELDDSYDIVLFLGIYTKLPPATRHLALVGALARADRWLAFRSGRTATAEATAIALAAGFTLEQSATGTGSGQLHLFRRRLRRPETLQAPPAAARRHAPVAA